MRHTLTSGNWIDVRPIQSLKAKDRDAYEGVMKFYVTFKADGTPDMGRIPLSMTLKSLQKTALLSRLLKIEEGGWSFRDDNDVVLPLPKYEAGEVTNPESTGEIPLDDWDEVEAILAPYIKKIERKPDPKETTTASSNGTSKEATPALASQQG